MPTDRSHPKRKPKPPVTYAVVRFRVPGLHCWPGATGPRAYLASLHRHLFHVEVRLQVHHDDREVEYHDLLDFCRQSFPGGHMGSFSCEQMARRLHGQVSTHYPDRRCTVGVFEDGEVGALIEQD